ncbi:TetR/AcrR family transcriptional regulator [Aurantimonas sp. VKM B-3413]|uniref:TetR/AcrR family transcriptional regulator n=1 Tax=Aurantimonas sp. VKM B-3413 TaxID=2779401 RepID=UPI001E43E433|nr:TetR/AcrR family transcriptional regulator [Aurantimonas sp. VKM B-3413]MCB8838979.1 TetR/AcrR family transcriptional regulator [Aurantimonas sp. VKM B-3413]
MDAAARVFVSIGFDGTSMDDVAAAAGVSKSTLYVYFKSKEHLFTALVAGERDQNIGEICALLTDPTRPAEILFEFGRRVAERLTARRVIQAHRTVIGVAERMPEIGSDFYRSGPERSIASLARYLQVCDAAGTLDVRDPELAAAQFLDLATAGLIKPRIFNVVSADPTSEEIDATVAAAVRLFTAGYGAGGSAARGAAPTP